MRHRTGTHIYMNSHLSGKMGNGQLALWKLSAAAELTTHGPFHSCFSSSPHSAIKSTIPQKPVSFGYVCLSLRVHVPALG